MNLGVCYSEEQLETLIFASEVNRLIKEIWSSALKDQIVIQWKM